MKTTQKYSRPLLLIAILATGIANGGDLDDGIAIDEPLNDDLKPTVNIPYILMKVKGAQNRGKNAASGRPIITQGEGGQGNITFGAGAKFAPGTVIINSSKIKNSNSISR